MSGRVIGGEEGGSDISDKRRQLSLQHRLTLVFVFIVLLPLGLAAYVIRSVLQADSPERAQLPLQVALHGAVGLYNERVGALEDVVRASVARTEFARLLEEGERDRISGFLQRRVRANERVSFLIALDPRGHLLGAGAEEPNFVPGFSEPEVDEILRSEGTGRGFVRTPAIAVRVPGKGVIGTLLGGFWLDEELLAQAAGPGVELSMAHLGRIFASTAPLERPVAVEVGSREPVRAPIGEDARALARPLFNDLHVVASIPPPALADVPRSTLLSLLSLLGVVLVVTVALAYLLARQFAQPLEQLSEGARAIAGGNFHYRIPAESKDEVGRLATAFNEMAEKLEHTITQLSTSRDQLQSAVRRVGDVLRSSYDIRKIYEAVVTTAAQAVAADAGILWTFTRTRDELYAAAACGLDDAELPAVAVGDGIAGLAAERGRTLVVHGDNRGPRRAAAEPAFPVALAVPVYSGNLISGIVVTYRRDPSKPFTDGDMETVIFLAEQGGVAIENVALHEEAQRLSLTDSLTGTYNLRYFQMQFRQAVAAATRFDRPFSFLMLDLDRFKPVNDTHGHQRGDSILVEFSQRVTGVLREVDTFARYGGDEFICLLSETDVHGAVTTAEKIREAIRSSSFGSDGEPPLDLTVSIGVAGYGQHGDSYAKLLESADRAMYLAKEAGRDRVRLPDGRGGDEGEPPGPPDLRIAK